MNEARMAHPPQVVVDWIDVAVAYTKASGEGCRECRDGLPSEAKARGHVECAMRRAAVFAAYDIRTFLGQPAECWYGLPSAPATIEGVATGGDE